MDYANLHVYRLIWSLLVLEIARRGLHPSQSLLVVTIEVYYMDVSMKIQMMIVLIHNVCDVVMCLLLTATLAMKLLTMVSHLLDF